LREQKPVVVVIDGLAASGGYYMAAAANRIFAPASAYIGNIGTRGGRPTDPTIVVDELSSGPYKFEGGSRFDLIRQLDLVAQAFVKNVMSQRLASPVNPLKLSPEEMGEARIYLGSEALALGLIDGEGSRTEGIQAAAELANLHDYGVVDLEEYLGIPALPPAPPASQPQESLLAHAPPGTIFMLDSRIPLPEAALPPALGRLVPKSRGDTVVPTGRDHTWSGMLLAPSSSQQAAGD
jgi:protease-4